MNYYYKELRQEGRQSDLLVNIFSVTVFATSILKNQANKHHCSVFNWCTLKIGEMEIHVVLAFPQEMFIFL